MCKHCGLQVGQQVAYPAVWGDKQFVIARLAGFRNGCGLKAVNTDLTVNGVCTLIVPYKQHKLKTVYAKLQNKLLVKLIIKGDSAAKKEFKDRKYK